MTLANEDTNLIPSDGTNRAILDNMRMKLYYVVILCYGLSPRYAVSLCYVVSPWFFVCLCYAFVSECYVVI